MNCRPFPISSCLHKTDLFNECEIEGYARPVAYYPSIMPWFYLESVSGTHCDLFAAPRPDD